MTMTTTGNKIGIVDNDKPNTQAVSKSLQNLLIQAGFVLDQAHPDIVISIGGDGTLLRAFHQYEGQMSTIQFVGIHTGHLGFYTDYQAFELEELVEALRQAEHHPVSYPILEVTAHLENGDSQTFFALNESSIRRVSKTLVADVFISDFLLERFRGDGLAISTPTGSTAYNKSVGGAVIHPEVSALQMTEIASLNNRIYRTLGAPIVVPESAEIIVDLETANDYHLMIDQLAYDMPTLKSLHFVFAKQRIQFLASRHTPFWRRVQDSFIGEVE